MLRAWLTALVTLASSLLAPAAAQSQLALHEDFEDGLAGWSQQSWPVTPVPGWHVSLPGECGVSVTQMAAMGSGCGYGKATYSEDSLISPSFVLPAAGPVFVLMDVIWDMDGPPGVAEYYLNVALKNLTAWEMVGGHSFMPADAGVLQTIVVSFWLSDSSWAGDPFQLRLSTVTDTFGNTGSGLHVDNIRIVTNAGTDLGLAAPYGPTPSILAWWGPLLPGTYNELAASKLPPSSLALLVIGLSLQPRLWSGVSVQPDPLLVIPLATPPGVSPGFSSPALYWVLPDSILPPGTDLYLQTLSLEAGTWSASNTLHVATP